MSKTDNVIKKFTTIARDGTGETMTLPAFDGVKKYLNTHGGLSVDLSGYVPFSGALYNLDMGVHNIDSDGTIHGETLEANSSLKVDTISISTGSISDTTGTIDFGSTDLYTTGVIDGSTINAGTALNVGTMTIAGGSIIDSSGAISFGNENLSTTGNITGAKLKGSSAEITGSGKVEFRDGEIYIHSNADGQMTIEADTQVNIPSNVNMPANSILVYDLSCQLLTVANGGNDGLRFEPPSTDNDWTLYADDVVDPQFYITSINGANLWVFDESGFTTFPGDIQVATGDYRSNDGSSGITTTQTFKDGSGVTKTMTIKNGIVTGIA